MRRFALALAVVLAACVERGAGSPREVPLSARVHFTGSQFQVTNTGSESWTNCRLEINGEYQTRIESLGPGQTVTMGAMTLTGDGGVRFNPLTHAPERGYLACDTSTGRRLYNFGWR